MSLQTPAQQPAPQPGPVGAQPARRGRRGVSRLWVIGALVFGLIVGAGATFGATTLLESMTPVEQDAAEVSPLSASQWFADDATLPEAATPPGSDLALGDAATVLIGSVNGGVSLATITVDAVTELDAAETELLKSVQPALAGQKLFRIVYTVEFVSGDPLAGVIIGDAIHPVDNLSAELLRVPVTGWNVCGEAALPAEIDESGDGETAAVPVQMCAVAGSPEGGADVVGAFFAQPGGPYSLTAKGQVTWLPATSG